MSTMTPMTPMTSWFFACFPLVSKWYQLDLHPIDQRSSSRVQLEAWLTSLLQTVKIFLLNRITHKVWTLRGTFPRDLWNVFLIVIQCYPFATGYCSTLIHSTHHLLCSIIFNDSHQRIPETHRILGSAKHAKHPVFGEGCSNGYRRLREAPGYLDSTDSRDSRDS